MLIEVQIKSNYLKKKPQKCEEKIEKICDSFSLNRFKKLEIKKIKNLTLIRK